MGKPLTVLVTGATGTFGRHAVERLVAGGHEAVALSRRAAPALPYGARAARGDLESGAPLAPILAGVDAVLHAATTAGNDRGRGLGDVEATRRIVEAARAAGVQHVLFISIVGVDRMPYGYYRRKLACENLLTESGVPYTTLRATQFHELLALGLRKVERWPVVALPLRFRFQSVAAADAASRAVELLEAGPRGGVDFGGPEVLTLAAMLRTWRDVRGRPRRVVSLPLPGEVARGFREGRNTAPACAEGTRSWLEHVAGLDGEPQG